MKIVTNWHIKCVVGLECACSLPIELAGPPSWLTREAIDMITVQDYQVLRQQFMTIYEEEEEENAYTHNSIRRSHIMSTTWNSHTFWFCNALRSSTGLHAIFYNHIQPLYSEKHAEDPNFFVAVCQYLGRETSKVIKSKLESKAEYNNKLKDMFQDSWNT